MNPTENRNTGMIGIGQEKLPPNVPVIAPLPGAQYQNTDEILILLRAIGLLWNKKWWIALGTALCTGAGIAYALHATPIYTSEAIIAPKEVNKNFGAGIMSQLGGLGGLMAAQMGMGNTSLDRMAIIAGSRDLAQTVITKYELLPHLFHKDYDFENKTWKMEDSTEVPTIKHGIKKMKEDVLTASTDVKRNVLTLRVALYDSVLAKKIVDYYLDELNKKIRGDVIKDASTNRSYLEGQLRRTADPWMIQKLEMLIGAEVERAMMVAGNAFDVLETAMVPLRKSKPRRTMIVALSLIVGFLLTVSCAGMQTCIANAYARSKAPVK